MAWFTREVRSLLSSASDPALARLFGARATEAGINVSEDVALTYGPFWSGVCMISDDLAQLPLHFYRVTGDEARERRRGHPLDRLVNARASEELTAFQFRRAMTFNAVIAGNGYAEIRRDGGGRVRGLELIEPWRVTLFRADRTRALRYRVANHNGADAILSPDDVLHLAGPSRDGLVGLGIVSQARQAIAVGLATEKFAARFFGRGATMGGLLRSSGPLTPQQRTELRESIESGHVGGDRSHRLMIVPHGLEYTQLGVEPEKAQFLATRNFGVVDIARWLRIPSTLLSAVHEGSSLTYRNAQEQLQAYVDHCLGPWATAWEQELNVKLISSLEVGNFYFKHNFAGLLKGDLPTRYTAFKTGVEGGWLSVNDVRAIEDMNPVPGGETYRAPAPQQEGANARATTRHDHAGHNGHAAPAWRGDRIR